VIQMHKKKQDGHAYTGRQALHSVVCGRQQQQQQLPTQRAMDYVKTLVRTDQVLALDPRQTVALPRRRRLQNGQSLGLGVTLLEMALGKERNGLDRFRLDRQGNFRTDDDGDGNECIMAIAFVASAAAHGEHEACPRIVYRPCFHMQASEVIDQCIDKVIYLLLLLTPPLLPYPQTKDHKTIVSFIFSPFRIKM
jgi:hypothetical protein